MPLKSASAVAAVNVITTLFMSLGYSQSGIGQGRRVRQERTGGGGEGGDAPRKPIRALLLNSLSRLDFHLS